MAASHDEVLNKGRSIVTVTPAGSAFFNYAVMFGGRWEWIAFSAGRPFRFLRDHEVWTGKRDPGPGDIGAMFGSPVEKPLGAAWTDLARLRDGDLKGLRRLLDEWGLWGFYDVVAERVPEKVPVIYPTPRRPWWMKGPPQGVPGALGRWLKTAGVQPLSGFTAELLDTAVDAIKPTLFLMAKIFSVAGMLLLLPEAYTRGRRTRGLRSHPRRPLERLGTFWAVLQSSEEAFALLDAEVRDEISKMTSLAKATLDVLARPMSPVALEAFLPPVAIWGNPPASRRLPRRDFSWAQRLLEAVQEGQLHPVVYYTDSFLSLCWREYWYAVEHNILYRRCDNRECGRFFMMPRGHQKRCDTCRKEGRRPNPRQRLIQRLLARGYKRDKAEAWVGEYHNMEQQNIRTGRVSDPRRYRILRKELGIGERLIQRLLARGYKRDKAEACVHEYHKMEQQKRTGKIFDRRRWEALRKELGIGEQRARRTETGVGRVRR